MMTLGSIIARLDDETFVEQALAGLDDLVLIARLRSAAEAAQEPLSSFASLMVARFVQHAQEDKWLALMTAASRADDPAAGALRCILLAALADEGVRPEAILHRHGQSAGSAEGAERGDVGHSGAKSPPSHS
jgi:hypothetical protein